MRGCSNKSAKTHHSPCCKINGLRLNARLGLLPRVSVYFPIFGGLVDVRKAASVPRCTHPRQSPPCSATCSLRWPSKKCRSGSQRRLARGCGSVRQDRRGHRCEIVLEGDLAVTTVASPLVDSGWKGRARGDKNGRPLPLHQLNGFLDVTFRMLSEDT